MSTFAIIVLVLLVIGVIGFVAWQVLNEARVRIESGTVGLVIARGAATERALEPGVHYIWPYRQQLVQRYPLREHDVPDDDGDSTTRPTSSTRRCTCTSATARPHRALHASASASAGRPAVDPRAGRAGGHQGRGP